MNLAAAEALAGRPFAGPTYTDQRGMQDENDDDDDDDDEEEIDGGACRLPDFTDPNADLQAAADLLKSKIENGEVSCCASDGKWKHMEEDCFVPEERDKEREEFIDIQQVTEDEEAPHPQAAPSPVTTWYSPFPSCGVCLIRR